MRESTLSLLRETQKLLADSRLANRTSESPAPKALYFHPSPDPGLWSKQKKLSEGKKEETPRGSTQEEKTFTEAMDLRDAEISEPLTKRARCVDKEEPQRRNAKRAGSTNQEEEPSRKKAKEEKESCEGKKESEPLSKKREQVIATWGKQASPIKSQKIRKNIK